MKTFWQDVKGDLERHGQHLRRKLSRRSGTMVQCATYHIQDVVVLD
jgi:hypothetical protein